MFKDIEAERPGEPAPDIAGWINAEIAEARKCIPPGEELSLVEDFAAKARAEDKTGLAKSLSQPATMAALRLACLHAMQTDLSSQMDLSGEEQLSPEGRVWITLFYGELRQAWVVHHMGVNYRLGKKVRAGGLKLHGTWQDRYEAKRRKAEMFRKINQQLKPSQGSKIAQGNFKDLQQEDRERRLVQDSGAPFRNSHAAFACP